MPFLAANLGFYIPMVVLEFLIPSKQSSQIMYKGAASRGEYVMKFQDKVSFRSQLLRAIWEVSGPSAWLNCLFAAIVLPPLVGQVPNENLWPTQSTLVNDIITFLLMIVVADFGMYVGHYILHRNSYFWEHFHKEHHSVDTPTAVNTFYIHPMDKTIQGALPLVLAAAVCRPGYQLFSLFVFARVVENTMSHSGLNDSLVDILTLRCLPGRAKIAHHDAHHKFSNYQLAKNFGESFWIWDYAFGTMSNTVKLMKKI